MKKKILQKIKLALFTLFLLFGFIPFSMSQTLSPLETQPSDFGEVKNPSQKEKKIDQNNPAEKKNFSFEMNQFIAEAKKAIEENPIVNCKN